MKKYLTQILLMLASCMGLQAEEKFQPEFYAFYNGLPSLSYEEEAKLLSELGYSGVCQVYDNEGGEQLTQRIAAYEKHGVKVLSIYLKATEEPIKLELVKPLANRGGMIELTVSKVTPEVVESIRKTVTMAEEMKIRVFLYPHKGDGLDTMPEAIDLIEKVNHDNLGVMFNLCHFLRCEKAEDMEKILERSSKHLFAVSTNGADTDGKNWDQLIKPLNEGTFPQERLFTKLKELGFKGPVGMQCYGIKDKQANLKASIEAWKELLGKYR